MYNLLVLLPALLLLAFFSFVAYALIKLAKRSTDTDNAQDQRDIAQSEEFIGYSSMSADSAVSALLNSRYYDRYKSVFDDIAIAGVDKYPFEWLLQSLELGHELENDGLYVLQSEKYGLPYFCETKREFEMFFVPDKPVMRGSIVGMINMILFYGDREKDHKHPAKCQYWQEKLRTLASNGNYEAQGVLCSKWGKLIFSEDDIAGFRGKYETNLRQQAEDGNCVAQLAVGEFLTPYSSQERLEWFLKAAQQGLSDAWYQLGQAYEAAIRFDSNNQFREITLSEEKVQLLKEKAANCYLQGAEANNGVMAAWCQYMVGNYYKDGDSILPKDADLAMYWYQIAAENGEDLAERKLESVKENLLRSEDGKRRQAIANNFIESEVVQECMRFFAVMLALRKKAEGEYDTFLGDIRCDTSGQNSFLLSLNVRVPQWEFYLRDEEAPVAPGDITRGQLFTSILESVLRDAQANEPRLQAIRSFPDLLIGYGLNPSIGDEWLTFETSVYLDSPKNKRAYVSELEHKLRAKYPNEHYEKDNYGVIKLR